MAIDEANFYDIFPKPINYYQQPLKEMGQKAVQFLVSQIEGNEVKSIHEILRGQLIIAAEGQG